MGQIVDLRSRQIGEDGPGGSVIDTCPICGLNGIWLNIAHSNREAFAHRVREEDLNVVEGCVLDSGGDA